LDTFLFAIPFVGMLLLWMFRLDAVFAAPKQAVGMRRPPFGIGRDGRVLFSDPDGRPWTGASGAK
jgi:hypothetical protein